MQKRFSGKFKVGQRDEFQWSQQRIEAKSSALNHAKIQGAIVQDGIKWSFNTPAAPHQGGIWERLIHSVKSILSCVLGKQTLDDEALQTLFCEVEAILNDRPITKVSDDPNDPEALTPNHILLLKGKPIFPPGLFEQRDLYIKRRWKQVQYFAELFWKRWIREYLLVMQERQRWARPRKNFAPGDIFIIADATASRGSWIMGRILTNKSDSKGLVRSVCLQTKNSVLERPVTKICLLLEATVDNHGHKLFLSLYIFCLPSFFSLSTRSRSRRLKNQIGTGKS